MSNLDAVLPLLERTHPGRRAQLKREILAHALLCMDALGVEATTIEHIRMAVGTSVGAIYHHFGNKEGLVAALVCAALDDQAAQRNKALQDATTLQAVVHQLVYGYVDWVQQQPTWARFLLKATHAVGQGEHQQALLDRNKARNLQLLAKLDACSERPHFAEVPAALVPALLIGPAEHHCRAWLAGRTRLSPKAAREHLAQAAWRALGG